MMIGTDASAAGAATSVLLNAGVALIHEVHMSDPHPTSGPEHTLAGLRLAPRVEDYLTAVVRACACEGSPVTGVVLFGSAATGGYSAAVSDVDLLFVLRDATDAEERRRIGATLSEIEARHGLRKPRSRRRSLLEDFADRITANQRAFFLCTRADLLSGDPARILGLPSAQARFVDRVAVPSIVASAVTLWGEDLLARVPLPPIRRFDVAKACFGLFNQALFSACVYPVLPGATKYAMDALKRSVHSCYFCYRGRAAPLAAEVAFFQQRHGPSRALARLLRLRGEYRPSFGFVVGCLPAIARLHLRTARENRFPRAARSYAESLERLPRAT
jgi:predicted nucleotidyltransferase